MATSNFLPNIWAAKLQESLKAKLVYGNCVNTDHKGEVSDVGQTVQINELSPITVAAYSKTTGLGDPQELDSTLTALALDQMQAFQFIVHDADALQANVDLMSAAMTNAAYQLSVPMDTYIAGLYTGVASGNTIGDDTTPSVIDTATKAYDAIVDLGVLLDESNVPDMDRFVVVPSWFAGRMLKDSRIIDNLPNVLQSGAIAEINGMLIYKSNNVPYTTATGTKYKIMAGYKGAISFVDQLVKIESLRSQKFFGDVVRGFAVYGAKLITAEGIAVLTANKA